MKLPEVFSVRATEDEHSQKLTVFIAIAVALVIAMAIGFVAAPNFRSFVLIGVCVILIALVIVKRFKPDPIYEVESHEDLPKKLLNKLVDGEEVKAYARRNVGFMLYPLLVFEVATTGLIYMMTDNAWALKALMLVICSVLVSVPIVRRARHSSRNIESWHVLTGVGCLALMSIVLWAFLPSALEAAWTAVLWLGDLIGTGLTRYMLIVWFVASIYGTMRFIEWRVGYRYSTTKKLLTRKGVILADYDSIQRDKMTNSKIEKTILSRIMGCDLLVVTTSGDERTKIPWSPPEFFRYV